MKLKVFHIRLSKEYLQTDQETINKFFESVKVKKTSTELISGLVSFWSVLVFYEDLTENDGHLRKEKTAIIEEKDLTEDEKQVYQTLRDWRQDKATSLNVPTFIICNNSELLSIVKMKPKTLEELSTIKGFGEQKLRKHGEEILLLLGNT